MKPTTGSVPAGRGSSRSRTPATASARSRGPSPGPPSSWRCCRAGRARSSRSAGCAWASFAVSCDDPDVRPGVRARVSEALAALAEAGHELRDVDIPELDPGRRCAGRDRALRGAGTCMPAATGPRASGYGPGTRALLELAEHITEAEYRRRARRHADRVAAGFARELEQVDVLAGPTMAFVAPPEDPAVRNPRGRGRGPVHRPVQPGPGARGDAAVRRGRGRPARRAPADGARSDRDAFLLSVAATYEEVAR